MSGQCRLMMTVFQKLSNRFKVPQPHHQHHSYARLFEQIGLRKLELMNCFHQPPSLLRRCIPTYLPSFLFPRTWRRMLHNCLQASTFAKAWGSCTQCTFLIIFPENENALLYYEVAWWLQNWANYFRTEQKVGRTNSRVWQASQTIQKRKW